MRSLVLALLVALGLGAAMPATAHADETAGYQQEQGGRSGFWTSRAPASGGAYRWRLLGIGVCLLCVTGTGMILLVRRAKAHRGAAGDVWQAAVDRDTRRARK